MFFFVLKLKTSHWSGKQSIDVTMHFTLSQHPITMPWATHRDGSFLLTIIQFARYTPQEALSPSHRAGRWESMACMETEREYGGSYWNAFPYHSKLSSAPAHQLGYLNCIYHPYTCTGENNRWSLPIYMRINNHHMIFYNHNSITNFIEEKNWIWKQVNFTVASDAKTSRKSHDKYYCKHKKFPEKICSSLDCFLFIQRTNCYISCMTIYTPLHVCRESMICLIH